VPRVPVLHLGLLNFRPSTRVCSFTRRPQFQALTSRTFFHLPFFPQLAQTSPAPLVLLNHGWRILGLLDRSDALAGLAAIAKYGRYKNSIIEDARLKLEVRE
jgi:hypothetical protein